MAGKKKSKGSILVIGAHSDDQILGVGGTMAKYAEEGRDVHTIIFSYGEGSHPHFQKCEIIKMRVKESQKADEVIGGKGVIFLGMPEGNFAEAFIKKKMFLKLKKLIKEYNPDKIFTHSNEDPLPDHRTLHKLVVYTCDKMNYKGEIYLFHIWNLFKLKIDKQKMVVDITKTFRKKLDALKCFKSQYMHLLNFFVFTGVYVRAFTHGFMNRMRYAEIFYKYK